MFCEKKKSKCPKENFQEKNVSVEFRVFGKKKWKKSSEKNNQSVLGGNFAKFVFIG